MTARPRTLVLIAALAAAGAAAGVHGLRTQPAATVTATTPACDSCTARKRGQARLRAVLAGSRPGGQ